MFRSFDINKIWNVKNTLNVSVWHVIEDVQRGLSFICNFLKENIFQSIFGELKTTKTPSEANKNHCM